jgi:lysozyme
VLGVDVSNWQPNVDWQKVYGAGARFAWLKASEGASFVDALYTRHAEDAQAAGLRVGAYHYARPGSNTADEEAAHFLTVAAPKLGELRPVLDLEETTLGPAGTVAWGLRWLQLVEQRTGIRPVIYTYPYFWRDKLASTGAFKAWPLWLASYPAATAPQVPFTPARLLSDWPVAAHQYTSTGTIDGISSRVDLNTALDFSAIITEAPMNLPSWLELIDNVIHVKKWVYAFARWRLIDKADPAKRPPEVPTSIPQPVWRITEAIHALCKEYAELIAAPVRSELVATEEELAAVQKSLSETRAALNSAETVAAALRDELAAETSRHAQIETDLQKELADLRTLLAVRDQDIGYALDAARGIVTELEGGTA